MTEIMYPVDYSGKAPSNKIVNEQHRLTTANWTSFRFVVPKFAPFYQNELLQVRLRDDKTGTTTVLRRNIDYKESHKFMSASHSLGHRLYGGISILNKKLVGTLIITYQTLGGPWLIDADKIAEIIADNLNNPLALSWEQVAELPYAFPPINHDFDLVNTVGYEGVIDALNQLNGSMLAAKSKQYTDHILDFNNPHMTTKTHVGLGNVPNYAAATLEDFNAAKPNMFVTTNILRQAVISILESQMGGDEEDPNAENPYLDHINSIANPHKTTAAQVGAYTKAEVDTRIAAHANLKNNPHGVTASQVGAYTKAEADTLFATKASLNTHINQTNAHNVTAGTVGAYTKAEVDAKITVLTNSVNAHAALKNNPHGVTAAQVGSYTKAEVDAKFSAGARATTLVYGVTKVASDAEADAGTDRFLSMTPYTVARRILNQRVATASLTGVVKMSSNANIMTADPTTAGTPFIAVSTGAFKNWFENSALATQSTRGLTQFATADEAQQGTITNKAISPATMKSMTQFSKASNGYRISPDGFIEVWGTVAIPGSGSGNTARNTTVNFPVVFPNACLNVSLTVMAYSSLSSGIDLALVSSTKTNMVVRAFYSGATVQYRAVGY